MDATEYCNAVANELRDWKDKFSNIQQKIDAAPCEDKDQLNPQLSDMRILVEQLDDRINELRTNCPDDWSPKKQEMDTVLGEVREKWERFNMLPPGRRLEGSNL
jgi:predicted nuclease with TOPRIM domain